MLIANQTIVIPIPELTPVEQLGVVTIVLFICTCSIFLMAWCILLDSSSGSGSNLCYLLCWRCIRKARKAKRDMEKKLLRDSDDDQPIEMVTM